MAPNYGDLMYYYLKFDIHDVCRDENIIPNGIIIINIINTRPD